MDAKLPSPANCLVIQSSTSIYVYSAGNIRDTYTLFGNVWTRSATSNNTTVPTGAICQPSTLISTSTPASFTNILLLILLFVFILNILTQWFRLRGQR